MKKMILVLLLAAMPTFAQLEKIETFEPIRTNYVEEDGLFVASAQVYEEYVEMAFFDKNTGAVVSFGVSPSHFKQIGALLTSYDAKDKDMYIVDVKRGKLFIRFVEKYGYVQSVVYMDIGDVFWYFVPMNRNQYRRLFDM